MTALDKLLADSDKDLRGVQSYQQATGSAAQFRALPTGEAPLRGQRCRSLTALWRLEPH